MALPSGTGTAFPICMYLAFMEPANRQSSGNP